MASISKLQVGQVLYTVTKQGMGNTTIKTVAVHSVVIKEVHGDHVIASWNGNAARRFEEYEVNKWKVKEPVLVSSGFAKRLATRAELAAMKDTSI